MDWIIHLCVAIGAMLILFFVGVPVFVTFLAINIAGILFLIGSSGFGLFANSIYQTATQTSFAAIPLFILMGEILFRSGAVDELINSVDRLVGKIRGRDYYLITVLSTIFGALCGSTVAVAALLGRTIMPGMNKKGYNIRLSSGAILGGATLAAIIPPSLGVIVLGSMVNVSIGGLLIAGILPGLLLAGLMAGYIWVRIFFNPALDPVAQQAGNGDIPTMSRTVAVLRILPFSFVLFFVIGLIMLGIATPSESAATGVIGSMVTALIYRKLSIKMFFESILSSATITAVLMIILLSSIIFGQLLSFMGASAGLMEAVSSMKLSASWMFLVLMLVPFVLCMFIDLFAIMMVAIPIYMPVLKIYEFDPIWFWMLFLINLVLGSMTPPFGYTLFALKGAAPDVPLSDIYIGAWPMVMVFLVGMTLMFFFPSIITFLPSKF